MINQIWKFFFTLFKPVSDNVMIVTVFFTVAIAIFTTVLLRKKSKLIPIVGGVYMLSMASMIENLPYIHERIHTALSVTSNIIHQSSKYLTDFLAVTGIESADKLKTINTLYYLEHKKALMATEPTDLYYHFYNAMDITRDSWFGYVDKPFFNININIMYLFIVGIIIFLIIFISKTDKYLIYSNITIIGLSFLINRGVFINSIIFCLISFFYINLLKNLKNVKSLKQKIHINNELINH